MLSDLVVTPAPHISKGLTTRRVMLDCIIGLVPAMIAAVYFFHWYAVKVTATCVIASVATEWVCNLIRGREKSFESVGDLSAVITGLILAFSVPPAIPWWAAVIGSAFAIAVGKMVFGGLGANIFNPAMVGRAFLMLCFGMMMMTWTVPATIDPKMPTIAVSADAAVDARTQATPLNWSKQAIKAEQKANALKDKDEVASKQADEEARRCSQVVNSQLKDLFWGGVGGSIGETSAIALIIGGIYLLLRRTITIHTPAAVILSAYVIAQTANLLNPGANISPWAHLCSGGLLIGAFFIATDPVTSPLTTKGQWIFGIGVGAMTMLIRIVGEYPEGVMFAILLMNAVTPLIDRFCRLTPAGGKPNV
jgi:Na+-translocating ferredoxin:NAD+ oxidoreductase subunit D